MKEFDYMVQHQSRELSVTSLNPSSSVSLYLSNVKHRSPSNFSNAIFRLSRAHKISHPLWCCRGPSCIQSSQLSGGCSMTPHYYFMAQRFLNITSNYQPIATSTWTHVSLYTIYRSVYLGVSNTITHIVTQPPPTLAVLL